MEPEESFWLDLEGERFEGGDGSNVVRNDLRKDLHLLLALVGECLLDQRSDNVLAKPLSSVLFTDMKQSYCIVISDHSKGYCLPFFVPQAHCL